MPTLQPKENWQKTGRWDAMDDLYKVKDSSGREMALGPTHEEVVVPLMEKFLNSYKDLPFAVYQFQNKFRMELRAKSGILRGREFLMKDLYSFHLDEKDLDEYYEKARQAYFKIFERAGIREKTFYTIASGGSFSKYSHEFQTVAPAGEDTIYVCQKCQLAINKELKSEMDKCPECGGSKFKEEKSIEVGNIFKLKNKYTAPFGLKVADEKGEKREIIMGCYGIGLGRLMGTIVEVFHDEKGIIWPESVAPFQVHLLDLGQKTEAEKICQELSDKNIEVLFDDREVSAGEKFADADLIGIPLRVVVSQKSLERGGVEVKERKTEKTEILKIKELLEKLEK
jgi:prolyl-tRNA synthetase